MRLIDADALLNELIKISVKDDPHLATIGNAFGNMILNAPTVYDVDKVLEELEHQRKFGSITYMNYTYDIATDDAIDIVKRGLIQHESVVAKNTTSEYDVYQDEMGGVAEAIEDEVE